MGKTMQYQVQGLKNQSTCKAAGLRWDSNHGPQGKKHLSQPDITGKACLGFVTYSRCIMSVRGRVVTAYSPHTYPGRYTPA